MRACVRLNVYTITVQQTFTKKIKPYCGRNGSSDEIRVQEKTTAVNVRFLRLNAKYKR